MTYPLETLMAYADGELDTELRRQIELAMATDEEVARQVARFKTQRLELQNAFAGMLGERVPDRLLEAARSSLAGGRADQSNVTDFATVRTGKAVDDRRRRWSWPELTSMAAMLLVGLVIGRTVLQPGAAIVVRDGRIEAGGALAAALTEQIGGAQEDAISIELSFKSRSGEYCRTFTLRDTAAVSGLACRDAQAWRVHALAAATVDQASDYRMAGAVIPLLILQMVEESMAGEALDAGEEAEARRKEWGQ